MSAESAASASPVRILGEGTALEILASRYVRPNADGVELPVSTYTVWADCLAEVIHDYSTYADVEIYTSVHEFSREHLHAILGDARPFPPKGYVVEYRTVTLERRPLAEWRRILKPHSRYGRPWISRVHAIRRMMEYGAYDETNRYPFPSTEWAAELPEDPNVPKLVAKPVVVSDDPDVATTVAIYRACSLRILQLHIEYNFTPYNCHHEYDCCGHWYRQWWPTVQSIGGDLYAVVDSLSRNI